MIRSFFVFIILLSLILFLLACNQVEHSNATSLMVDLTEGKDSRPLSDEVLSLFEFEKDKWSGEFFRFSEITDIGLMPVKKVSLGYEKSLFSNELIRNRNVDHFKREIESIVNNLESDSAGRPNSSIYLPIVKELGVLNTYKFKSRTLIIYSDLVENSPIISLYDPESYHALETNPDSIQKLLENHASIPDLQGIRIILVYAPQNLQNDERYRLVSSLYKKMLESHGAHVEITASL